MAERQLASMMFSVLRKRGVISALHDMLPSCHTGNGATVSISDLEALKTKIDTLVLRTTELREIQLYLVHITPAPILSRLNRPHDRMLRLVKVLRRMFIRR